MALDETSASTIMRAQENQPGEACMVDQERWAGIRRLFYEGRVSISEIGRRMDLDRKTVRRALRQATWYPYRRAAVSETLLTAHAEFVRTRAPQGWDTRRGFCIRNCGLARLHGQLRDGEAIGGAGVLCG